MDHPSSSFVDRLTAYNNTFRCHSLARSTLCVASVRVCVMNPFSFNGFPAGLNVLPIIFGVCFFVFPSVLFDVFVFFHFHF